MAPKKIDFESWSLDELWALHGEISGILSARIRAEKGELEKRLAVLSRGTIVADDLGGFATGTGRQAPPQVPPGVTEVSESPHLRNLVGARQAAEVAGCSSQVGTQDRRVPD